MAQDDASPGGQNVDADKDSWETIQEEQATKKVFLASKNVWEDSKCRLKVEKSLHKWGNKYSCIRVMELETGAIRVLKKAKEPNDTPEAYYETVKIQTLGALCCSLFCKAAPPSCQPRFLQCNVFILEHRPKQPLVLAEDLVDGEYVKRVIGIKPQTGSKDDILESHKFAAFSFYTYYQSGGGMAVERLLSTNGKWSTPTIHSADRTLGGALDGGQDGIAKWTQEFCERYCPLLKIESEALLKYNAKELIRLFDAEGFFGATDKKSKSSASPASASAPSPNPPAATQSRDMPVEAPKPAAKPQPPVTGDKADDAEEKKDGFDAQSVAQQSQWAKEMLKEKANQQEAKVEKFDPSSVQGQSQWAREQLKVKASDPSIDPAAAPKVVKASPAAATRAAAPPQPQPTAASAPPPQPAPPQPKPTPPAPPPAAAAAPPPPPAQATPPAAPGDPRSGDQEIASLKEKLRQYELEYRKSGAGPSSFSSPQAPAAAPPSADAPAFPSSTAPPSNTAPASRMSGALPGAVTSVTSPVARVLEDSITVLAANPNAPPVQYPHQPANAPAQPAAPYGVAPPPQAMPQGAPEPMRWSSGPSERAIVPDRPATLNPAQNGWGAPDRNVVSWQRPGQAEATGRPSGPPVVNWGKYKQELATQDPRTSDSFGQYNQPQSQSFTRQTPTVQSGWGWPL